MLCILLFFSLFSHEKKKTNTSVQIFLDQSSPSSNAPYEKDPDKGLHEAAKEEDQYFHFMSPLIYDGNHTSYHISPPKLHP